MNNRINLDDILEKYEHDFFMMPELEQPDGKYISVSFYDYYHPGGKIYFEVYGKWHPRKREIEYDESVLNSQVNNAILKIKQKRMKNKLRQIKKDF